MKKRAIFLSASVPNREPYIQNFDAIAIREAVLSLVAVTVRERELVFGGHPAISPLVEHAARSLGAINRVHIYQSRFFENKIPEVAKEFKNFHWTNSAHNLKDSLEIMRREMIGSRPFAAAVLIGGMEGLFDELSIFKELHPHMPIIPIASTGGAAEDILNKGLVSTDSKIINTLKDENRYRRLFTSLLPND